jgi:uncharacterized surface protein with fasciclin (FAS1) repeats
MFPIVTAVSLLSLLSPCRISHAQEPPPPPPPPVQTPAQPLDPNAPKLPDVIDTASKDVRIRRFVEAIKAAGLTDTLKGQGPFTILVPVDAAFGRLPEGTWDDLQKPENKEKLATILKYHVIPGRLLAADIAGMEDGATIKTAQGGTIVLKTTPRLRLNNAGVISSDVIAGNGVIHLVDTVLIPPPATATPEPAKPDTPPPATNEKP